MTSKQTYKQICEQRPDDVPLFQQYWWLEAVCDGKKWDVALAYDGDNIVGAMPFHFVRRMGFTFILQPQLTQFLGPLFFYGANDTQSHRLDFEKNVVSKLIDQLEVIKPAATIIHTSPQIVNWLPFYWRGYRQTTRYTYRIPDISDVNAVFAAFDKSKRQRKITKIEKQTSVRYDMTAADFAVFHHRYWESKGCKDLLSESFIERVCSAAISRGQGVIGSLYDEDSKLLAARFVAYDNHSAYSLLSAMEPSLHRSGHSETLMWELIRYLSGKTHAFDFEGSMDEGIEYFYRSFGAQQTPFFELCKYRNSLFELVLRNKHR